MAPPKNGKERMQLSPVDYHVIQIQAITALLDSVLNHIVLDVRGSAPDYEIRFVNETNQMLYNIMLVDFFSPFDNQIVGETKMNGIDILLHIGENPLLSDGGPGKLKEEVVNFRGWLDEEITVEKLWFSSVELETALSLKRQDYIYICGNISKHCFPRLTVVSKRIRAIFERNSHQLELSDALSIIPEFYEWFHTNVFAYSATRITEMLNDIRWAIQEYLHPVYEKSIRYKGDDGMYEFEIPPEITTGFVRSCFWDLMNEVRRKPNVQKFQTPSYLNQRY